MTEKLNFWFLYAGFCGKDLKSDTGDNGRGFGQTYETGFRSEYRRAFTEQRPCTHYAREIPRGLFLRLGLPSTLIRHDNGPIRKRSSNWRNLKTLPFCFGVNGKHFENEAFRKRCHDNHVISLSEFSSNTNPKWGLRMAADGGWKNADDKMRSGKLPLILCR